MARPAIASSSAKWAWVFPARVRIITALAELGLILGALISVVDPKAGAGVLAGCGAFLLGAVIVAWYKAGAVVALKLVLVGLRLVLTWTGYFLLVAFVMSDESKGRGKSLPRPQLSPRLFRMGGDRIVGDGGNFTVYQRPDGSQYALDPAGRGTELPRGTKIIGKATFDSRRQASGSWAGSRSQPG